MRRRSILALSGLALAVLLVRAPAALLAGIVDDACGGRCRLAAPEGTLWAGRASLYLRVDDASAWQSAGRLWWNLAWFGLRSGLDRGQGELRLSPDGIKMTADALRLPAGLVLPWLPGLPRTGWGGELELAEAKAAWTWDRIWQAQGTLRWRQAQTSVLPAMVLGDFLLRFQRRTDGGAGVRVDTEHGSLRVEGAGELPPGGTWGFDFEAQAAAEKRAVIEPFLRGMGQPQPGSEGRYRIRWQGP